MQSDAQKIIIGLGIFFLFIIVGLFAYHRFSSYLEGPKLLNINLKEYETTDKAWKKIELQTKNTKKITLNSEPIPIQQDARASTLITFHPHENVVSITLTDAFQKERTYLYHVYLKETEEKSFPKTLREAREKHRSEETETLLSPKQT